MDHVAMLKKYFKARGRMDAETEMGYPFVTISRQAGAGGHTLARDVVRAVETRLPGDLGEGWEVFDHRLCLLIAQDPELNTSFNELVAERYRPEMSVTLAELLSGESRQYRTMKKIFEVVRGLCCIGKVVIVGRAGNCVAADLPLHVSVRLVAGENYRVRGMMELLDLKREETTKEVRRQDRQRAKLLDDFFNKDINDPLIYDAVFNSEAMKSREMAEVVALMLALRNEAMEREG